jgi:hypothetical protein
VQKYYSCSGVLQGYRRDTVLHGYRISSEVQVYNGYLCSTGVQWSMSSAVVQE